jgi:hypothetical protein
MANNNTFVDGFTSDGSQVTTLAQLQGSGLTLPSVEFINIRGPGKLETLFLNNNNSAKLYSVNKPQDLGLADALKSRLDYKTPTQGQRSRTTTIIGFAAQDANLIRKFLASSKGFRFIGKQLILQGFQAFDETKVYNPASPLIAAIKRASFGALDYPTRHLDTSNVVGGIVNGLGLGRVVSGVGALLGKGPSLPAPPRSSVASEASRAGGFLGITTGTFSSLIGGGDRSDKVVTSIARGDVKDLLRGNTATNAYNAPRYSRWVNISSNKGFFGNVLSAAGKFIQNNTLVGGILPPKQPWAAEYRADEKTYDFMLNANKMFSPESMGSSGGGILSGLLNSIGFGKKANYSQAVPQRFYNKSGGIKPNVTRLLIVGNRQIRQSKSVVTTSSGKIGQYDGSSPFLPSEISVEDGVTGNELSLRYGDLIKYSTKDETEQSDQLLNYKTLVTNLKGYVDTFTDNENLAVKRLIENFDKSISNIIGNPNNIKYTKSIATRKSLTPLQFAKFSNTNAVGMEYLVKLDPTDLNSPYALNDTYQGRFRTRVPSRVAMAPTRLGSRINDRYIRPTNNVDYVNALQVLNEEEFEDKYSETAEFGKYGPDIIKFYFYDIVNKKYIPFNATVKSIVDDNQAQWETIEYLGRPDKLYYYKGFTRNVNFNFSVVAHSVKELMPMWNRINYLVGLTRPANYTMQSRGGFMISPMVQLTLGDFYKNHNVVINNCNVSIPEEASWETIPEDVSKNSSWYYGPNGAIEWDANDTNTALNSSIDTAKGSSKNRVAQFPRVAEIQISMAVLEKDRPKTGRAIWGDAPVPASIDRSGELVENYPDVDNGVPTKFSTFLRHDNNQIMNAT